MSFALDHGDDGDDDDDDDRTGVVKVRKSRERIRDLAGSGSFFRFFFSLFFKVKSHHFSSSSCYFKIPHTKFFSRFPFLPFSLKPKSRIESLAFLMGKYVVISLLFSSSSISHGLHTTV